jgi:hypothetical protein
MHSHTHAHTATHTHIPELKFSSIDIKPCTLHTPPTTQAHCVYFLSGITSSNERDHACALGVDGQRCVVSRHCEWWQEPVCVYHCATPAILNVIPPPPPCPAPHRARSATETRVPYGLVNVVLRDLLFGSDGRAPLPLVDKVSHE